VSIGLLSTGSQQLNQTTSLVATGTNDVFTFQNPPTGYVWSGTLSVTAPSVSQQVPIGALMTANVGATSWGEWGGNSVFGPVQANQNQQLVVTAQGLTAGVTYLLNWIGSSDPAQVVQPLFPAANSTALTAQTFVPPPGVIYTTPVAGIASGVETLVTVPANVRTLMIQGQGLVGPYGPPTNVELRLNFTPPTGAFYNQPPYYLTPTGAGTFGTFVVFAPIPVGIYGGAATVIGVTITGPTAFQYNVFGDTAQYNENVFYNGVAKGAQTTITGGTAGFAIVSGPCRLLTAELDVLPGNIGTLQLNGTGILRGDAAAGTNSVTPSISFPPNTILPLGQTLQLVSTGAGTVIASVTYSYP